MIKNKGNYKNAYEELSNDNNNSVLFLNEFINQKEGELKGCVFTIKDIFAIQDKIVSASSKLLKNFKPLYNSFVYEKLMNEGAQLVAQVNCDEFALGGTGTYSSNGMIYNPIDKNRIVGGSSSGSAATFTKNIAFSIASDTGDSVRLPSSYIGVVGFKPSYGAVSRWGLFPYSSSLDTVAWFTHNVNDSYNLAKTLYGKDQRDMTSINVEIKDAIPLQPKSIAYFDCFEYLDKEVAKKFKEFIAVCESNGIKCNKKNLNLELLNSVKIVYDIISFSEASSNLSNLNGIAFGKRIEGKDWMETFEKTRTNGFGKMVQRRLTLGSFFLEKENQQEIFIRAQKIRRLIKIWIESILKDNDLLMFPASPSIAPMLKDLNDLENNFMRSILTTTNLIGNPSINFKLGESMGLPFNINFDANIYEDKKLFSHVLFLEKMWKDKDND